MQELKHCDLAQDMREALKSLSGLDSKLCGTSKVITSLPDRIQRVEENTVDTKLAVRKLSSSFTEVEATLEQVLQHILDQTPSAEPPQYDNLSDNSSELVSPSPLAALAIPQMKTAHTNEMTQLRRKFAFKPSFGAVFVYYQKVNTQLIAVHRGLRVRIGKRATRITVHVIGSLHVLSLGLHCSIVWGRSQYVRPNIDIKLRVYNNVAQSAPIIAACESGDRDEVQSLFSQGKASPFDRFEGKMSLLDVVFGRIITLPMRKDPINALRRFKDLYAVFMLLIYQGVDPGQLWNHIDSSPLPFLGGLAFYTTPEFWPLILDLTRTIIEHSIQDPFATADFTEMLRLLQGASNRTPLPVTALILSQDCWAPEWEIKEPLTPFCYDGTSRAIGASDAHCIRTWLSQGIDHGEAILSLIAAAQGIANAVTYEGLPVAYADQIYYHHIFACLEFGIDIQDDSSGPSIMAIIRQRGILVQLRTALRYFKWEEEDIEAMIEGDLVASLAYQLAYLERAEVKGSPMPTTLAFKEVPRQHWNTFLADLHSQKYSKHMWPTETCSILGVPGVSNFLQDVRQPKDDFSSYKKMLKIVFPNLRSMMDILRAVFDIVR